MSDISDIRSFSQISSCVNIRSMSFQMSVEDKKVIAREIMLKRGELLFSSALVLCEGVTEEQIIPAMFEIISGHKLYEAGVTCVSVGGKNYAPFVKLACSLGIPTLIVSDNDGSTHREIEAQLRRLRRETGLTLSSDEFAIEYLAIGNDIEAELMSLGLRDELVDAVILCETKGSENPRYVGAKRNEIESLSDGDLLVKLRDTKASYAGYLGDVLRSNPHNRTKENLVPLAFQNGFAAIQNWLTP